MKLEKRKNLLGILLLCNRLPQNEWCRITKTYYLSFCGWRIWECLLGGSGSSSVLRFQSCQQMKAWWGCRVFPSSFMLLLTGDLDSALHGPLLRAAWVSFQHGSWTPLPAPQCQVIPESSKPTLMPFTTLPWKTCIIFALLYLLQQKNPEYFMGWQ